MYGPPLEVAPDIKRLRAAANNLLVDMCSTTLLSSATPHSAGATSRLITPCMLALHPLDDPLQRDLLVATLGTHPVLQASFLRSSPLCAVAPSASLRYIAASDLISKILGLPMSLDPACVLLAPGGGDAAGGGGGGGGGGGISSSLLADFIAPKAATGGPMSAGLQHVSQVVKLATIRVVIHIMMRLGEASRWAGRGWSGVPVSVVDEARRMVRGRLPDFQVLLALRLATSSLCSSGDSQGAAAGGLILPRVVQAMGLYVELFPECLAESRVDLSKLMADEAMLGSAPVLHRTLGLLLASPPMSGSWLSAGKGGARTHFGSLLGIFACGGGG